MPAVEEGAAAADVAAADTEAYRHQLAKLRTLRDGLPRPVLYLSDPCLRPYKLPRSTRRTGPYHEDRAPISTDVT